MYIYIEKVAEVLDSNRFKWMLLFPKYQDFPVSTLVADRGIQSLRWRIQDKLFNCSKHSYCSTVHIVQLFNEILCVNYFKG